MERSPVEMSKGHMSMKLGIMQGVTDHSCCKEADFISAQRGPEGGLCFR